MPLSHAAQNPVILGIVGDSAAGKTTLTSGIAAILDPDRVACICSDDYHRYGRPERGRLAAHRRSTRPPTISTSSNSTCACCARVSRS